MSMGDGARFCGFGGSEGGTEDGGVDGVSSSPFRG